MIVKCELIKLGSASEENLDYNRIIFKIIFENEISSNNIRFITLFLDTLIAGGTKKILVDMKDIEFIDSTGIGAFVHTAKTIRKEKGEIAFLNVPDQLVQIFKVVRLNEYIKMFDSVEESVRFFS